MPYIEQKDREKFRESEECRPNIQTKGELEYCIFKLMQDYKTNHYHNYANLHDCTYAAQHCADEFRRRFLDVREDHAQDVNGDIIGEEKD